MRGVGRLLLACFLWVGLDALARGDEAPTPEQLLRDGNQAFERGAFELAAEGWTKAAAGYERIGDRQAQSETLVRLAEAYQALGQHRLALQALQAADQLIGEDAKSSQRALVLWTTGRLYLAIGQPGDAQRHLREALQLARTHEQPGLAAGILIDLGNAYGSESKHPEALAAYAESAQLAEHSGHTAVLARALINRAVTSSRIGQHQEAKDDLDQAMGYLQRLPASHDKSYDLITVGLTYQTLRAHLPNAQADLSQRALAALQEAADSAEANGDPRAASYAWGHLGALYETDRRYQDALELTRRAIFKAQQAAAPEALYRWHSQAGRLHHASGRMDEAVAAYRRAVFALQSIRPELVRAAAKASAGSFRETYGAVYFGLVDLLLQRASTLTERTEAESYLKEARDTVELFKIDEMRDYFRDDCVDAARSHITALETVSKTAAVIYPILLPDRTELLVSLPSGMRRVSVPVTADPLTQEIRVFRKYLEKRTTQEYLPHAQRLYDWLIRPLEPELAGASIDTLVFVPDGPLRTIPMAALHDGKQFLISKYAVATSPGLTLTDPHPLSREKLMVLSGGLSEAVQGFPPLPNVTEELEGIKRLYGGTLLLDKNFLVARVEQELKEQPFSVVHIASHGQFESDVQKSFVLAFDGKLTMDRLDQFVGLFRFRDDPLALLTLSACETAAGDDRAALGLAGVAIKAGARSALATLWFINDQASSGLVAEFYRQLHDTSVSKAGALQRAQLMLLGDPVFYHPAYWAPFMLLNNWL